MKCKDCNQWGCVYRTTDAEKDCAYQANGQSYSAKAQWISDTAVKLMTSIPYEWVTNGLGKAEPRHLYAARIASEMADAIFG